MSTPSPWVSSWPPPNAPATAADVGAAPQGATPAPQPDHVPSAVVPIRSMSLRHLNAIQAHLLSLDPQDRYLRFGYAANDEHILKYVSELNFERDELFGIFNRKLELIAMAHLAFSLDPQLKSCAEFGVSVVKSSRGRGYGSQLFERAAMHSRNVGVSQLFIHALSENTAMLKIARTAGAVIQRDGSESEAHLRLPPANFDSRVIELINEQVAITDYHLKAQARRFWEVLNFLQSLRQGLRQPEQVD